MVDGLWVGEIYTPLRRLENALIQFENGKISAIQTRASGEKPVSEQLSGCGGCNRHPWTG